MRGEYQEHARADVWKEGWSAAAENPHDLITIAMCQAAEATHNALVLHDHSTSFGTFYCGLELKVNVCASYEAWGMRVLWDVNGDVKA